MTKSLPGWQSNAWKKEDKDREMITVQRWFIGIMFALCLFFGIGWIHSPTDLTIHVPPDITNGATFKVNEIPPSFIYSFAYEIWQGVNYWSEDGTQDYPKNIRTYAAYLTPKFQAELLQEYDDLKTSGQVQRQRSLQGMNGVAFESAAIKRLSNDTWEIDLKMRLVEYRNHQIVKDIDVFYPLKAIRWDISTQNNPYGLAIDGFVAPPVRLKTNT